MEIKFAKINDGGIIPSKRDEDAGFDIWCDPAHYGSTIELQPHTVVKVHTGIACAFDKEWVFIVKERGSVGSRGVAVRSGVIDSGFRNEIIVCLENTTDSVITLDTENAIAQGLMVPVPVIDIKEIEYDDLKKIKSRRGLNGWGSTNKKG